MVALLVTACSSGVMVSQTASTPASLAAISPAPASAAAPSASASLTDGWSYEGATGPTHWGELDPAYSACTGGKEQSPIDISSPDERRGPDPVFDYKAGDATIVNDGHTIMAVPVEENTITVYHLSYTNPDSTTPGIVVDSPVSTLVQLQFRAPSEHVIGGEAPAAAEMQFVHRHASGVFTIVGVMVVEGEDDNAAWAPYIDVMTTPQGTDGSATIDWPKLLPSELMAWYYTGSLTTPPCTEGVHWIFLTEPISLSAAQIDKIRAAYVGNVRPIQPLGNGRGITIDLKGD